METSLSGTGALGWGPGMGPDSFALQEETADEIPLNFYPPHMGVGPAQSASLPLLLIVSV